MVEFKKNPERRTVDVRFVKALVGVCVDWDTGNAYFVTTSDLSTIANLDPAEFKAIGYATDLFGASDLLKSLQLYNVKYPPLYLLNKAVRDEIIRANQRVSLR